MSRISIVLFKLIILLIVLPLHGCFEDSVSSSTEFEIIDAAEFLYFIEAQGDFVNSEEAPGYVLAEEVHSNLDQYLVIDIRTSDNYSAGHIPNSINLHHSNLVEHLESIDSNSYEKIVTTADYHFVPGDWNSYNCPEKE